MEIGCYVHNLIRINMSKSISETIEKKQKNESQQVEFANSKKLKSFLQSAINTATSLTNYIPKITSELVVCINTHQASQKDKIKLKKLLSTKNVAMYAATNPNKTKSIVATNP